MASWIGHMIVADELLKRFTTLDKTGFCVGNIAPDCNIENADWSDFTPSREITHWMTGESKLTSDYEGFYNRYIRGKNFSSPQEGAFYWGYYAHLITDVEFGKFIRNSERIKNVYARIRQNKILSEKLDDENRGF